MDELGKFLARHPVLVGLIFATMAGATAYNTFKAGVGYAQLRAAVAYEARAASEALGG